MYLVLRYIYFEDLQELRHLRHIKQAFKQSFYERVSKRQYLKILK